VPLTGLSSGPAPEVASFKGGRSHLDDPGDVIRGRMERRTGHFMPATLLESQRAVLERPGADERPIVVDVAADPAAIVAEILRVLRTEDAAA